MEKPRGIIFDFGSTVLCEESFDALTGNSRLLEFAVGPHNLTPVEIQVAADEIHRQLRKAGEELCVEVSVQSFQRLLYETLGITLNIGYPEAERQFWRASTSFTPAEGIVEVLSFLKANNIKTGILSNTGFSGNLLEEELKRHNLAHYFSFVISSSDYGFRKPNPLIFNVAVKKMNLEPSTIWFAGDKLEYDIKGSIQSGLHPVWYNPQGQPNVLEYECLEIRSWYEFIDKLRTIL